MCVRVCVGWTRDSADVFARVCKAIFHLSLDGETTTPQPAIITSKTKALLLPNYSRDVLHLLLLE